MNNQDSLWDLLTSKKPPQQSKLQDKRRSGELKRPQSLQKQQHKNRDSILMEQHQNAKPDPKQQGFSASFLDFSNLKGNDKALEQLRNALTTAQKEIESQRQKEQIKKLKEADKTLSYREERKIPKMQPFQPPKQKQTTNKRQTVKKDKSLHKQPEPGDIWCARCGAFHARNYHKKMSILKPPEPSLAVRKRPLPSVKLVTQQKARRVEYEEDSEEDLDDFIVQEDEEEEDDEVRNFMRRLHKKTKQYKEEELSDIEEANYETVAREEKKSTKLAKLEDEREQQQERQRELAKLKRRLK